MQISIEEMGVLLMRKQNNFLTENPEYIAGFLAGCRASVSAEIFKTFGEKYDYDVDSEEFYFGYEQGLISPAAVAVVTVLGSKNKTLINDFKKKIIGFYRIKPIFIVLAVLIFAAIVSASIGTSVLLGGSIRQFSFTDDFSFSIGGSSALLTILLASSIEELGWRGYGEDAVGAYHSWFKESIIFGCIWAVWHLHLLSSCF